MNELSWLIYLADVAGSAKAGAGVCAFGAFAWSVKSIVHHEIARATAASSNPYQTGGSYHAQTEASIQSAKAQLPGLKKAIAPGLIGLAVAGLALTFTPTSGTIYAIAASEMGERVIQSETGDKAI